MIGPLAMLAVAAIAFVGTHFLFSSRQVRPKLVGALGEDLYALIFLVWAAILFAWMVIAYIDAPYVEFWPAVTGTRHLAMSVMALAAIFLVAGTSGYNPTAIGLDRLPKPSDPARGIYQVTRHPVMWALGLWGVVHMLANGDAASLILFGSLTFLALGGTVALDRKKRGAMSDEEWQKFLDATSNVPFVALIQGRARLSLGDIGWWRIGLAIALYLGLLVGHPIVFGVSPLGG